MADTDNIETAPSNDQHVIIVSGLSGAGKSTVLNALEDMGFHCIDNLPASLLHDFGTHIQNEPALYDRVALGMDARAPELRLEDIPGWLESLRSAGLRCQLLFLTADDQTLVKRFSETRRRHPLSQGQSSLQTAIAREHKLMEPVRSHADFELDTSATNIHQLRHQVWKCVGPDSAGMTVVLQSFAFSRGVPSDVDFLFDARALPNPYWNPDLRGLSGRDPEVTEWLEQDDTVIAMVDDIRSFLMTWLPGFEQAHRSYVTVGIGCTGGRHRSVFLAERIGAELKGDFPEVMIHHRDMES